MNDWILYLCLTVLAYVATTSVAICQIGLVSPSSEIQQTLPVSVNSPVLPTALQSFIAVQQTLGQSLLPLISQGGTLTLLQAWQQQNATSLANREELALEMGADSALEPQPLPELPDISANASPTLKDFLTAQTALANARAQIHNQLLNALPLEVSDQQISQMLQSEEQLFQQQHIADLLAQQRRAQTLANESAQQPMPMPPPLSLPANITSHMASFMTAQDQLMRDQITFINQYVTATPAVRDAAMAQWTQLNANRLSQVQALAQNLFVTTSTPQN